jgi:hypothetical protein
MDDSAKSVWSLVAIACLLFGLAAVGLGVPFFLKQHAIIRDWPAAQAHIHSSEVVEMTAAGGRLFATRFELSFTTGDRLNVVTFNAYEQGADRRMVEAAANRYPAGSYALIRYNPGNPYDISLDTDQPRRFFRIPIALGITGMIFLVTAAIIFVFTRL